MQATDQLEAELEAQHQVRARLEELEEQRVRWVSSEQQVHATRLRLRAFACSTHVSTQQHARKHDNARTFYCNYKKPQTISHMACQSLTLSS